MPDAGGGPCVVDGGMGWCRPGAGAAKRCEDAVQLACAQVYWLAQDADHLAWSTYTGDIYATAKPNGPSRVIALGQENINGFSMSHGHVYWSQNVYTMAATTGFVARRPLDGGIVQVLASGLSNPQRVVADADYAYWISAVAGEIRRVPLTGGMPQTIISAPGANSLAIDGTSLYWTNQLNGQVVRAPLAGGSQTTLFSGQYSPQWLHLANGWLYWGEGWSTGGIHRGPVQGGTVGIISANESNPTAPFAEADRVWWLVAGGPVELRSKPLDGGPSVLELATSGSGMVVVDETDIYLSNGMGVWRVPK